MDFIEKVSNRRLLNGDDCRFWMTTLQICEIFWPCFKQFTTLAVETPMAFTFLRPPLSLSHFRWKPERFIHSIWPFPKTQNPFRGFASHERRRWSTTCTNHGGGVSDSYIVNIPLQLHFTTSRIFPFLTDPVCDFRTCSGTTPFWIVAVWVHAPEPENIGMLEVRVVGEA
jgi:hypothetical protein